MNNGKKKAEPALARALQCIDGLARSTPPSATIFLPSLSALVAASGVSRVTVCRALRRLSQDGRIRQIPAGGYVIEWAGAPVAAASGSASGIQRTPALPRADHGRPSWEELHQLLLTGIREGRFPPGRILPLHKELAREHGVAHNTVRRALATLTAQGLVERFGRGHRVRRLPAVQSRARVVVIARMGSIRWLGSVSPRAVQFWHALEAECLRLNIGLELIGYETGPYAVNAGGSGRRQIIRTRRESIMGYLVMTIGFGADGFDDCLGLLAPSQRPVAVLNESGDQFSESLAAAVRQRPLVKAFSIAISQTAGKGVGDYLISLGHRHVACFTRAGAQWSDNRAAGLCSAFDAIGVQNAVTVLPFDPRRFAVGAKTDHLMNEPYRTFQNSVLKMWKETAQWFDPGTPFFLATHGRTFMEDRFFRAHAEPLFRKALGQKRITAWVCVNDQMALAAQDYLEAKGVKLPRTLSLIGFDDTIEAFGRGLTSYNFNVGTIVQAMLGHMLKPVRHRGTQEIVELPGIVMQRGTSGPVKGK